MWLDRLRTRTLGGRDAFAARNRWDGEQGRPRSTNGASSSHVRWAVPAGDWASAAVTLEVLEAPRVAELYFWALQVSFVDRGRRLGAAHLGLQWHPGHPGSTAVNWGGYGADGNELEGDVSALPSATGNVNTRDFAWRAGTAYRLEIHTAPSGPSPTEPRWRGTVTDLATGDSTVVRDLWVPATAIDAPVVWSEVFAPCDAPPVTVRWSALELAASAAGTGDDVAGSESSVSVLAGTVSYQSLAEGGCATGDVAVGDGGVHQRSGVPRVTPHGARLRW